MRSVDVRTLKARASELLYAVENGESIVITRRGRPVARLDRVTIAPEEGMRLRGLLADLRAELDRVDLVAQVRQLREESTSRLEQKGRVDPSPE